MNYAARTFRDVLYEKPGPKTRSLITVFTVISALLLFLMLFFAIRSFYVNDQLNPKYWFFFTKITTWQFIGKGLVGTFEAAVLAGIMAFIMGFTMMLARISRFPFSNKIAAAVIEFTRGVPTLLFIYFFFLIAPGMGLKLPSLLKISLPVAISASGVVAEVLRSGVNAVPKGQKEAGLCIGMTEWQTFIKVIFPQGFKYVIPALISEIVIVVKDTTYAYVVSFPDLMQNARVLISNYDAMLSVYLTVAVIYILINYYLNKLASMIEKKASTGGFYGSRNRIKKYQ